MLEKTKTDLVLGLLITFAAVLVLFVWIPFDVETGIFEKVRRRTEIGDSFAPAIAASLLMLGGILLVFETFRHASYTRLSFHSVVYAVTLLLVFAVAMAIMRWAGPIAVDLFAGPEANDYRPLRDTPPWKYIGFVLGGTFLVTALISAVEQKVTFRSIAIGLLATIAILLVYDLPFDDLLVPPNGDV